MVTNHQLGREGGREEGRKEGRKDALRASRPIHFIHMQSSLGRYTTALSSWTIAGG
jgi:hypothetical protein